MNSLGAFLFNFGCIITGIAGIIFGFGLFAYGKSVIRIGGALFTVSLFFLSLVGVFTLPQQMHYVVAYTFGLTMFASYVFLSLKDWGHLLYLIVDITYISTCIVFTIDTPFPVWEPALVIATMAWIFILGLKMYSEEERMFNKEPNLKIL